MESVLGATSIYLFLLLLFRISGKRTLAEVTPFDLILLLIISEATQSALVGTDDSLTNAVLLVATLVGLNVLMSEIKLRYKKAEHVLDGVPQLIVENGRLIEQTMQKERVDVDDVLHAAREGHGLERLDQVKYAVLERNGRISIIPTTEAK